MLTYYMKCKKDTKNVDSKVLKKKKVEQCYHQNVLYVAVKNQDF